jgi:hypothetical protein
MVLMTGAAPGRVTVWQCIGCGRIEGPQNCIGVCEDRKVELVYADVHDAALAQIDRLRREAEALKAVVERLAHITPHADGWERSYRALQAQARAALAAGAEEA